MSRVQLLSDLTVFSVLIVAVELSIQWNEISGVNELDTVAQLVPPLIAGSVMLRAVHQLISLRRGDSEADGRAAQSPCCRIFPLFGRKRPRLGSSSSTSSWYEGVYRWTARYSGGRYERVWVPEWVPVRPPRAHHARHRPRRRG